MIISLAMILTVLVMGALLFVRTADLPTAPPVSPVQHLVERKASIYENLRDLQFEYRVGKLSDADYQQTKLDLQKELSGVLAQLEAYKPERVFVTPIPVAVSLACAKCGAKFEKALKFCGECGAPMGAKGAR